MEELVKTPPDKTDTANADTLILPKEGQSGQKVRTLKHIIDELNDTYFFSFRRYRLKKEFLERLRDPRATANPVLLQHSVLAALLKYASVSDRHDILLMKRLNNESALEFGIIRGLYNFEEIKFLVEAFKIPIKPEWVLSSKEDPEIKSYLQEHTPLYAAAQKKDVEGFKIALKTQNVNLTEYVSYSIVDFIQSKIHENQGRNAIIRYFLNRKWNRMLRATTGQIKKQLFAQTKQQKAVSTKLLALLNQCPPEEIYYALQSYDHYDVRDVRLYDKFQRLNLRDYLNIYLQMERITSEEVKFGLEARKSKVPSHLKIVRKTGDPIAKDKQEVIVPQEQPSVLQEVDARTLFHEYLRENNNPQVMSMLRHQSLSAEDIQEVLNSQMDIDDDIKESLQSYLERVQRPSNGARRALSFGQ